MNPYPLALLNHLTLPVAIESVPLTTRNFQATPAAQVETVSMHRSLLRARRRSGFGHDPRPPIVLPPTRTLYANRQRVKRVARTCRGSMDRILNTESVWDCIIGRASPYTEVPLG